MLERFPDSSTKMLTHCSFILKRHERQVSPSLKAKNFLRVSVTPAFRPSSVRIVPNSAACRKEGARVPATGGTPPLLGHPLCGQPAAGGYASLREASLFPIIPSTSVSGVADADLAIQYGVSPGSGLAESIAAPAPSCPRLCCFSKSSESLVPPKSPMATADFLKTTIATAHSCFSSSVI